jgi:hypothetical protein
METHIRGMVNVAISATGLANATRRFEPVPLGSLEELRVIGAPPARAVARRTSVDH